MTKISNLNIRIDCDVKEKAEILFKHFGITLSDAVNIFLHQSIMVGGLPFEMKLPRYNCKTEAAIDEAVLITTKQINAKEYASTHVLFEDLDSEC